MVRPEPPAGQWASTFAPFPADHFPYIKVNEFLAPFSWSSWVPGQSSALVRAVSFWTRKLNNRPSISAWHMWTTDGESKGVTINGYQDLEEHVLYLGPGEKITSCTIWMNIVSPNEHEACVGRVRLATNRGQILDTAPNDVTLGTGLSRPVGNGLLCGALGNQASYATKTLCLLFLIPGVAIEKQIADQMITQMTTRIVSTTTKTTMKKRRGRTVNWDLIYA